MTTSISSINSTQSALQVNGVNSVVFDATGIVSGADLGIKTIDATVASNAITVTFAANQSLEFRSATLTSGVVTQLTNTSALSLVIAATDSFAAVTAAGAQRLAIIVIDNAGTMELAASNLAGGVSLDETGVITTATTATTKTAIKAGAVRTGVVYRVVGFIDVPFTTAVGWGTIALKQGVGGQALAAMSSAGFGQAYTVYAIGSTRLNGTTYYNTTSRTIKVMITVAWTAGTITVDGFGIGAPSTTQADMLTFDVLPGKSYVVTGAGAGQWVEIR